MFKNVPHVKKTVVRMQVKHLLSVNSLEIVWSSFSFLTLNKLLRKEETCFSCKIFIYLFWQWLITLSYKLQEATS